MVEAYETLGDAARRQAYDVTLAPPPMPVHDEAEPMIPVEPMSQWHVPGFRRARGDEMREILREFEEDFFWFWGW